MGLDVEMFLEVMKMLNSLFDCGCEVNLDEENKCFGVTGRDYHYPAHDPDGKNVMDSSHPFEGSYIERTYSCEPWETVREGTPEEDEIFSAAKFNGMINQIRKDNERLK